MDYFAGLDISMDETHVCVLESEGVVVREEQHRNRRRRRSPANWRKRQVVIASCSRPDGWPANPVSRVEPTRSARSLRREPAGLPGAQSLLRPTRPTAMTREGWRILARTGFFEARACEVAAGSCAPLF